MTSAQVVETSVTNNSSSQNYTHPDDHTIRNCSQLDKHNSKENNDIPRDKSRCNAPPDWLKTTIARIVPSLQLAQTEPLLHLTPYSYTFQSSIENLFAYAILRAALFSAASPAERLRSAGSLAIIIIIILFFYYIPLPAKTRCGDSIA